MFTGIIEAVGTIKALQPAGGDARCTIDAGRLDLSGSKTGDSVAVNGVCLTMTAVRPEEFDTDLSGETLSCTTLGGLRPGARVNLETALRVSGHLGGHFVSGHVDGTGRITARAGDARSMRFDIDAPDRLARYICPKGSICVDGVSLTVNAVDRSMFSVNVIPLTLEQTVFSDYAPGSQVNLEIDMIARYLERLRAFTE